MDKKEILRHVDHTLLKPYATWEDIRKLCEEAIDLQTASVCVPPTYVKRISEEYGDRLTICTVIGFPLGYCVKEIKAAEAKQAIKEGADEIDMVINICDVRDGNYDKVLQEIKMLREACGDKILKVIVEACYLTDEQKIKLCEIITEAKADYIKTSTGFGEYGATIEDVELFRENIGPDVKIKAAGGIRTQEEMEGYIIAGCDRIGTSGAAKI